VLVVGLGKIGELTVTALVHTLQQALLHLVLNQGDATPSILRSIDLSCLLVGSGNHGVEVKDAATALVDAVSRANASLMGSHRRERFVVLEVIEHERQRAEDALAAFQVFAAERGPQAGLIVETAVVQGRLKPIEARGRTFDALLNPKYYALFPGIDGPARFRALWQNHPDYILANMAHAAYVDVKFNQALFKKFEARVRSYNSEKEHRAVQRGRQAIVVYWEKVVILSFRGTEGAEQLAIRTPEFLRKEVEVVGFEVPGQLNTFLATDILDDLNFLQVPYNGADVHRGFLAATMELWPKIEADLNSSPIVDGAEVYVTGHGLGAAMALIAGMSYKFKRIVTFGEPRVGKNIQNSSLASSTPHIRYVNDRDPVTTIVPTVPPFSFEHHGEERKIIDSKKEDDNRLFDHSIINYAQILGGGVAGVT
ncbi:MAG TPA: lipase family protein, partial [Nitrospira sp.]|nr:lipase family protein [Nitrospira sp.]